jgi:hypothetical protein
MIRPPLSLPGSSGQSTVLQTRIVRIDEWMPRINRGMTNEFLATTHA